MSIPAASTTARSLYARLLRAARAMPTSNRRNFIRKKARDEFEAARGVTDPERLAFLVSYGETSLENVIEMAKHLVVVERGGGLAAEYDPAERAAARRGGGGAKALR